MSIDITQRPHTTVDLAAIVSSGNKRVNGRPIAQLAEFTQRRFDSFEENSEVCDARDSRRDERTAQFRGQVASATRVVAGIGPRQIVFSTDRSVVDDLNVTDGRMVGQL
jgi:hypothetical protein